MTGSSSVSGGISLGFEGNKLKMRNRQLPEGEFDIIYSLKRQVFDIVPSPSGVEDSKVLAKLNYRHLVDENGDYFEAAIEVLEDCLNVQEFLPLNIRNGRILTLHASDKIMIHDKTVISPVDSDISIRFDLSSIFVGSYPVVASSDPQVQLDVPTYAQTPELSRSVSIIQETPTIQRTQLSLSHKPIGTFEGLNTPKFVTAEQNLEVDDYDADSSSTEDEAASLMSALIGSIGVEVQNPEESNDKDTATHSNQLNSTNGSPTKSSPSTSTSTRSASKLKRTAADLEEDNNLQNKLRTAKKLKATMSQAKSDGNGDSMESEPPKKPRGRPKKKAVVSESSTIEKEQPSQQAPHSLQTPDIELKGSVQRLTIAFSGSAVPEKPQIMKFAKQHAKVIDVVDDSVDLLCIGPGKLKLTSKLLKAVALGKQIISDSWILASVRQKKLLDHETFLASIPESEKELGVGPEWSSPTPRTGLLDSCVLYITPALKHQYGSGYRDIESLAMLLGATKIISTHARDVSANASTQNYIVMGLPHGDIDATALSNKKIVVHDKELLSRSILRGQLAVEGGEFRIMPGIHVKTATKNKKGKAG